MLQWIIRVNPYCCPQASKRKMVRQILTLLIWEETIQPRWHSWVHKIPLWVTAVWLSHLVVLSKLWAPPLSTSRFSTQESSHRIKWQKPSQWLKRSNFWIKTNLACARIPSKLLICNRLLPKTLNLRIRHKLINNKIITNSSCSGNRPAVQVKIQPLHQQS